MRALFAVLLLAISGAVQAAPVTIDFEDVAVTGESSLQLPQGFNVTSGFFQLLRTTELIGCDAGTPPPDNSEALCVVTITDDPVYAEFEQIDSNAVFSLSSADIFVREQFPGGAGFPNVSDAVLIQGWDAADNLISELSVSRLAVGVGWQSVAFDSSWTGISRLRITAQDVDCACPTKSELYIDNIVVDVVPIPAAVWLFASALGLIGWLRRSSPRPH